MAEAEAAKAKREEEARIKAEAEAAKAKQEEEAKQKAEAEKAKQEEAERLKAETEAAKAKEEEEARLKAEAEAAKAKQEEKAGLKADADAARAKEEEETKLKTKQEEEARQKAEAENAKQVAEKAAAEAAKQLAEQVTAGEEAQLGADVRPASVGDESSTLNINVLVVGARNLEKSGMFGKADPYIVVSHKDKKKTSATINNDLNPQWNFENTFVVSKSSKETLRFEVYDKDMVTKDDLMGSTEISITDAAQMKEGLWIPLQGCKSGELFVSVEVYQPKTGEEVASEGLEDSKSEDTDITETGNKIVEDAAALTLAAEAAEAQRKEAEAADALRRAAEVADLETKLAEAEKKADAEDEVATQIAKAQEAELKAAKEAVRKESELAETEKKVVVDAEVSATTTNMAEEEKGIYQLKTELQTVESSSEDHQLEIKSEETSESHGKDIIELKDTSDEVEAKCSAKEKTDNSESAPKGIFALKKELEHENTTAKDVAQSKLTRVTINVVGARNLSKTSKFGKADPYVLVSIDEKKFKSVKVSNSSNPEWNFVNTVYVDKESTTEFSVEVYDEDKYTKDDFLGRVLLKNKDLSRLQQGQWIPLEGCKSGEILISAEVVDDVEVAKDQLLSSLTSNKNDEVRDDAEIKTIIILEKKDKNKLPEQPDEAKLEKAVSQDEKISDVEKISTETASEMERKTTELMREDAYFVNVR